MVLVDTPVWIDFLRQGNAKLKDLLNDGEVATHAIVIGELHVGNLSRRKHFLTLLGDLPMIGECSHDEVLFFIEEKKLYGKGIGYSDAHIICSAIVHEIPLWTLDKSLEKLADSHASRWR